MKIDLKTEYEAALLDPPLCACNCGNYIVIKPSHKYDGVPEYTKGHHGRGKSKYFDIDLNQTLFCACKCGSKIILKWWHKYDGIPTYLPGHERRGKAKYQKEYDEALLDPPLCACRCGRKIVIILHHKYVGVPKYLTGHIGGMLGKKHSTKSILKIKLSNKDSNKGRKHTLEELKKNSEKSIENWKDSEYRDRVTKGVQESWADPEQKNRHVKAILKGNQITPNKPETLLLNFLHERYPDEWQFVGDGKLVVAGKNPDFVHTGKKLLIELYGDYWHQGQNPDDRIKLFEPFGYKTLVIWEKELKNIDIVVNKIKTFVGE